MGIITDILKDLPLSTVLREKLQDMEKRYLELEKENAELKKENAEIKEEIRILKDKKSQYGIEPQFKNGLYYFDDDGPFCTACWDNNHKKIRLREVPKMFCDFGKYACPVCNATYK